jgi:hypothetical protein
MELPAVVASAVRAGWQGLTTLRDPQPGGPAPALVCVAPKGRLDALRREGLSLLAHCPSCPGARRWLFLAVGDDPAFRLSIDLTEPDGRVLVRELTDGLRLSMSWVAAGTPRVSAVDALRLTDEARLLMRDALGRAGEWHVEPGGESHVEPGPGGRDARLVEGHGAPGEVVLLVPEATLAGLGPDGTVCLGPAGPDAPPDLRLRFLEDGAAGPERCVAVSLEDDGQRRLAMRVARQHALTVIAPGQRVRIGLDPEARGLVLAAALSAAARLRRGPAF